MRNLLLLQPTSAGLVRTLLFFALCASLAPAELQAQTITPGDSRNYITTWKTDNQGVSGNTQVVFPVDPQETYNFHLYWEEVSNSANKGQLNNISGPVTLTFPHSGTYRVEIIGAFPRNFFALTGGDNAKLVGLSQWGNIQWKTMQNAFFNAVNMVYTATDSPDLSSVTDLTGMFRNAKLFNGDLSGWNVSGVTNTWAMFESASSFNGNIRAWDVSKVIDMGSMFLNATAFNQDIGDWDVSSVRTMIYLFNSATNFNQDLSGWNVSSVLDMRHLFYDAVAFNQSLGSWKIAQGANLAVMLNGSGLSKENYDATLIGWAAQPNLPSGINFGATGMHYCVGSDARQTLISDHSWTIVGDIEQCPAAIGPDQYGVLYVDINVNKTRSGYTGTGDSWANAIPQLADALRWVKQQTSSGNQQWSDSNPLKIFVAKGTYLPAYGVSEEDSEVNVGRNNSFILFKDTKLYGGFDPLNGVVNIDDARILPNAAQPAQGTILSGDLAQNDNATDFNGHSENVYHVVIAAGDLGSGSMDGFTIAAGAADGSPDPNNPAIQPVFPVSGGGVLALYTTFSFTDCMFFRNFGMQGGGMVNVVSNTNLTRCKFIGNEGEHGGGAALMQSSPTFEGCFFFLNNATQSGGGIYSVDSDFRVTNTKFQQNKADAGGAIQNGPGSPEIDKCEFIDNSARNGGGIMNSGSNLTCNNSTFSGNSAKNDGGAIHSIQSGLTISGSNFTGNSSEQRGGAMRNDRTTVAISNTKLIENSSIQGGAIINESCPEVSLVNCLIAANTAAQCAGMMSGLSPAVSLESCTITGNIATNDGSGLLSLVAPTTLSNVIIWKNSLNGNENDPAASIVTMVGSLPVLSHSLIANWGGSSGWNAARGVDGGGNIDVDPLFVDPANKNYNLQICSPAINKGDNALVPAGITEDLAGYPRIKHNAVDLGVFEYQNELPNGRLAIHNDESTRNVSGLTEFLGNNEACRLIARVEPNGSDPVSGSITAHVSIDPAVAFHNNSPYIQRHFVINAQNSGSARITLFFTQAEFDLFSVEIPTGPLPANPTDETKKKNLRVFQFEGASGATPADFEGAPVAITPNEEDIRWDPVNERWEVAFNVTGFSGFFVGSVAAPLPVRLVSFQGIADDDQHSVRLEWEVAEQQNISAYEIDYSNNGFAFTKVGEVPAVEAEKAVYRFRHSPLANSGGNAFYRLRIAEADGSFSSSQIIRVKIWAGSSASVYPVPMQEGFWFDGQSFAGSIAELRNIQGVVIKSWTVKDNREYVNAAGMSPGIYFIKLADGSSVKIVKK